MDSNSLKRFWLKVNKNTTNACWEWTANKLSDGYGRFYLNGKARTAHRVSWVIHNKQIPDGLCVLHHCDNPSCVNPDHLFVGTHQDNIDDMMSKGRNRQPTGETHNHAKLTEKNVREIRMLSKLQSVAELANNYGVGVVAIRRVINHTTWKHI